MSLMTLNLPATVIIGAGARHELPAQMKRLGADHAFIVTDAFLKQTGLPDALANELREAGCTSTIFAEVQPDPTDQNVAAGLQAFRASVSQNSSANNLVAIVAVGGGSAIDCAKAISILTANPEPLRQYMGYHKVPRAGVPLIAIPTTAGTGSEATRVAVITDTAQHEKMMILDARLTPAVALVDYELSLTMPKPLTAHVGVDTLTHGIEAYVSKKANGMTDPMALSCIALTAGALLTAWGEPENPKAREAMALAAYQGGAAFSNASVCLVHGMSRPLGALYHVAHGLSNAVLLPEVTQFSLSGNPARYAVIARIMGLAGGDGSDEAAGYKLVEGLETLNEALQIPPLRECVKVGRAKFDKSLKKMAQDALASGSPQNNPVVPTAEQIVEIYRAAW